jgi:hypothetical protein
MFAKGSKSSGGSGGFSLENRRILRPAMATMKLEIKTEGPATPATFATRKTRSGSAIEISPISFISPGSGHVGRNFVSVCHNDRKCFSFALSRLNPRLMKLTGLFCEADFQPIRTEGPAIPATFATRKTRSVPAPATSADA